jgi:hypothetical protein
VAGPIADAVVDEFRVRYYRWALGDARRELGEEWPLLRGVKSALVIRTLAHLASLPADRRPLVMTALVKRFHRRAVELTGDSWGADEEAIARDYLEATRIPRPEEEGYRQALLHEPGRLTIARSRFLAAVRGDLAPVLGVGAAFASERDWRYDTPIGPWTLVTLVDVGGRHHQLSYTQTIRSRHPRPLGEHLSICAWLGVGGQTAWDQITEADTAGAARGLARICAHFLEALPALLDGLSPA